MVHPTTLAVLAAMIAFAGPAVAQSRYGPAPSGPAAPGALQPANLSAAEPAPSPKSLLGWPGKSPAAVEAAPAQPAAPARPQAVAPWAQRMAPAAQPATLREPAAESPVQPAVAVARAPQTARAPLPANLYDTPPAPRSAQAAPAPQPTQTALLGAPPIPGPSQPTGPRFYSVYREYGVRPDAIPTSQAQTRGEETSLREVPSTPTLASPDDTQYVPPRPAPAQTPARRAF